MPQLQLKPPLMAAVVPALRMPQLLHRPSRATEGDRAIHKRLLLRLRMVVVVPALRMPQLPHQHNRLRMDRAHLRILPLLSRVTPAVQILTVLLPAAEAPTDHQIHMGHPPLR